MRLTTVTRTSAGNLFASLFHVIAHAEEKPQRRRFPLPTAYQVSRFNEQFEPHASGRNAPPGATSITKLKPLPPAPAYRKVPNQHEKTMVSSPMDDTSPARTTFCRSAAEYRLSSSPFNSLHQTVIFIRFRFIFDFNHSVFAHRTRFYFLHKIRSNPSFSLLLSIL